MMAKVTAKITLVLLFLASTSVCYELQQAEEYLLRFFGLLLMAMVGLGTLWFWNFLDDEGA